MALCVMPRANRLRLKSSTISLRLSRVISVYVRNLEKLGIQVTQRTADFALVQKRMDEFDFDMTSTRFPDVSSPGNEMFDMFGSKAADEKGSSNAWGLKDPAVDRLVEKLVAADSRQQLVAAARALDRVLLHETYYGDALVFIQASRRVSRSLRHSCDSAALLSGRSVCDFNMVATESKMRMLR